MSENDRRNGVVATVRQPSKATFFPDRELAEAVLHVISMQGRARDLRTGDILITLMAVAKEWTKMGNLPPDAERMVLQACATRLFDDRAHATFQNDRRFTA